MATNDTPPPMPEETRCPQCGAVLPPNAPAGLCPACLLRQGVNFDSATFAQSHSFEPPSLSEIAPLFPQLEILEFIGKGGMGAVYKARQKDLDRIVALKILPPTLSEAPAFAERFAREAKALAKLNHPGIVTIHEFGRADGLYYFLMEFVDGVNLRQLLAGGRVSPREALAIVPEICDALQFAHDHGIVHRDIKPANILIDRRGRVKVADFGLAKLIEVGTEAVATAHGGGGETSSPLTEAGKVMGTPSYMAPEQTERPDEVDHRADIYSLGVVLYELLTGELPTGKLLPPSRKVRIDVRLDEAVLRALERSPELRYQQASEMKTQVETISSTAQSAGAARSEPPPLHPPHVAPSESRFSRKAIIGATWAALFFTAALPGYFFLSVTTTPAGQPLPGPAWQQFMLALTLLPLGLAAPFGTTILGVLAISQIRRSAGRLYGLGLAVFDALLFPLLALDVLIVVCAALFFKFSAISILLLLLVCAVVDYLIIRKVWRAVKLHSAAVSTSSEKSHPQRTGSKWKPAWTVAELVLILATMAMFGPRACDSATTALLHLESPGSAPLPQGSVEVLGVSYHPSKGQLWWSPDGTPIGKDAFAIEYGVESGAKEDRQAREFALRIKDLPADASWPIWKMESAGWSTDDVAPVAGTYDRNSPFIYATPPASAKTVNIKAGIAIDPWNTLAENERDNTTTASASRIGLSYTISFLKATETEGRATITALHNLRNQDVRIIAVDIDGKEHSGSLSYGQPESFAYMTATFDGLPLARVKRFLFQARPYRWLEIRNVALNPNPNAPGARVSAR